MTLREWWCVYDARVGEPKYGSMSESEVESCYETLMAAKETKQ